MKNLILSTLLISTLVSTASFAAIKKRSVRRPQPVTEDVDSSSQGGSMKKRFDSLGDNKVFVDRVQNMDNDRKVRIVQNRIVDMNNRLEIGGNYGFVGGGDSYLDTTNYGAILDYHINSRWSIGARYQRFLNSFTPEAKSMIDRANAAQATDPASQIPFPKIDAPQDSGIATISYYPIYGKLNLFDAGVAHFDVYTVAGYGKMNLKDSQNVKSTTDVFTAGGGLAVWLSQHFATRFEVRYETYRDLLTTENRRENTVQGMATLSVLL